jgi:hypothetical protein
MRTLLAVALCAAPAAQAADPVVLLPAVGSGKEMFGREVDAALRQALVDEPSVEVLPSVETRQHVNALAEMGLICLPEDIGCLAKLGIAAEVALVLVPVVERAGGGRIAVEIGAVDVGTAMRTRLVRADVVAGDAAALRSLVRQALGVEAPQQGPKEADPPPPDPPPREQEKPLPLGLVVGAVGGAVGALAIAGAVVCDLIYTDTIDVADAATRKNVIQPAGAALWIAGVAGLAVLGSGVVLTLTDSPGE